MTQYWPSEQWSYSVNGEEAEGWTDLKMPFALIGSHPRCHIQIEYNRLPPVVYFAVACGPKIEVWPLCEIAFPIWGRLKPDTRIMIGRTRLRLKGDRLASLPPSVNSPAPDDQDSYNELMEDLESAQASLVMEWETGERVRKLNRRISVLGEGHPSLMRMHGLGLRTCELGVICVGMRIWVIQLNPDAIAENEPLVRELIPGGESIWVGDVHLWANQKGSYAESRFGILPPATNETAQPVQFEEDIQDETKGADLSAERFGEGLSNRDRTDADAAAIQFTDRILERTERRALRANLLKWTLAGMVTISSLVLIGMIIVRGVLPIVQAVYAD